MKHYFLFQTSNMNSWWKNFKPTWLGGIHIFALISVYVSVCVSPLHCTKHKKKTPEIWHSYRIHSMANFLCKQWWRHTTSQLSVRDILILFIKMNSWKDVVKLLHLSFLKQPYYHFHCNNSIFSCFAQSNIINCFNHTLPFFSTMRKNIQQI